MPKTWSERLHFFLTQFEQGNRQGYPHLAIEGIRRRKGRKGISKGFSPDLFPFSRQFERIDFGLSSPILSVCLGSQICHVSVVLFFPQPPSLMMKKRKLEELMLSATVRKRQLSQFTRTEDKAGAGACFCTRRTWTLKHPDPGSPGAGELLRSWKNTIPTKERHASSLMTGACHPKFSPY